MTSSMCETTGHENISLGASSWERKVRYHGESYLKEWVLKNMCKGIGCDCCILLGVVRLIPVVVSVKGQSQHVTAAVFYWARGCCWDASNGVKWCQMKVVCAMNRYVLDWELHCRKGGPIWAGRLSQVWSNILTVLKSKLSFEVLL